jgi:quinol monooxygenase YgiN
MTIDLERISNPLLKTINMKIYLTAIIKAKEEHREEVAFVLQNMVKQTNKEEESEQYSLHQGLEDENLFTFYEIWKSEEGLQAHNQQAYIKAFGELVTEKLQEQPTIILTKLI